MEYIKRFNVVSCLVGQQEKPALIISPDELNDVLPHILVAPVTETKFAFPCRLDAHLMGKKGQIALDLIQPVLKENVKSKIGALPQAGADQVLEILKSFFAWD